MIRIYQWKNTPDKDKRRILRRAALNIEEVKPQVREWIEAVREQGDEAVLAYADLWLKMEISVFRVNKKRVCKY